MGGQEYFVARRYGDFSRMYKRLRTELPGKVLPPMPRKNKQSSSTSNLFSSITGGKDDDASSLSSVSTMSTVNPVDGSSSLKVIRGQSTSIPPCNRADVKYSQTTAAQLLQQVSESHRRVLL